MTKAMHSTFMISALASCLFPLGGCGKTSASAQSSASTGEHLYWSARADLQSVEGYGPEVARGKKVYEEWCAACHGPGPGRDGRGLTGTEALEALHNGQVPAILDERTDLTPEVVSYFVRNGNTSMMPFFRKTEISEGELADLGAYLSRLNPDMKASKTEAAK